MSHVHAPARRAFLLASVVAAFLVMAFAASAVAHGGPAHHNPAPSHHGHGHHGPGPHHGHGHPAPHGRGHQVDAMTRNLYLGADLAPAIGTTSVKALVEATGGILREVTANRFPTRAKGLAAEILAEKPDLVGLQEVALWRTAAPSIAPLITGPSATALRYDYLQELLGELNAGAKQPRYEVVVVQNEFDLEAPANENGLPGDGPGGELADAEINGRLTMRDVILARNGDGVHTSNPQSGNFANSLAVPVLGKPLTIKRGWTATDAEVRGSHWFRFVNTHLEAFDPAAQVPSVRAKQAAELVAPGGPATSNLPVVLVGDLNSDDDTVEPGDQQAYRVLLEAGLVERSTATPLGCCLKSSLLAAGAGGSVADFDHQVDHVMTRNSAEVTLQSSAVTGLLPVNGFWDSDHAGLFSALRFDD